MQDYRIETFLSACQTLNFTESARQLHITQPAVSQQIKYLETVYGAPLFRYQGRKLSLTRQGTMLRDACRSMVADEDMLKRRMAALDSGSEQLRLGLSMTVGEFIVQDAIADFIGAHPEFRLSISISDTHSLLDALRQGTIDCAIVEGYFDKTDFGWEQMREELFVGVCARHHTLPKEGLLTFDDLLGDRVITREEGSGTRSVLEHALASSNLTVENFASITETNSITLIKHLVRRDCGISFLYESAVRNELAAGTLTTIPMGDESLHHTITGVWRAESAYSEFYQNVLAELM